MGYHNLEKIIDLKPIMYTASLPFPTSTLKAESEGVLLEYANSCGLLGEVTGTPNLIQTFRGRRRTPKFNFDVNKSQVNVDRRSP
jgi:hypothetical protein